MRFTPDTITEKMVLQHLRSMDVRSSSSEESCGIVRGYHGALKIMGFRLWDHQALKKAEMCARNCSDDQVTNCDSYRSDNIVFTR